MLFRKDIEHHCAWCSKSIPTEEGYVMCVKHGIKKESDACRSFQYDPLKRTPPRPATPRFDRFQDEDFSL